MIQQSVVEFSGEMGGLSFVYHTTVSKHKDKTN